MKFSVPLVTLFIGLVTARPLQDDVKLPPVNDFLPLPGSTPKLPNSNSKNLNREACRQLTQQVGAAAAATRFGCDEFPPEKLPPVNDFLPLPGSTPKFPNSNSKNVPQEVCKYLTSQRGAAKAATQFGCDEFQ